MMASRAKVRSTLKILGLSRKNHCIVVPATVSFKGMLLLCKDYLTWGPVSAQTIEQLLEKRGEARGEKLSDDYVSRHSQFKSLKELAAAMAEGKASLSGVKGSQPAFRLSPPRKGFGSIKKPFPKGGIGFRKEGLDSLIARMI